MGKYRCVICNYIYNEEKEANKFEDLPDDWRCPVCNSPKSEFILLIDESKEFKEGESTVSDILVEQMAEWGIKFVFGIPGTSSLGIVEAIRKNDRIKYIQVRHEESAAFMASAYGKLTGHISACLTVAGPGATNLATGLYDAKLDHSPVLAITGMVKRQLIGPGSFQEIDQHSFFEPVKVFNETLMSEDQTVNLITLAMKHALLESGVAHIGIPNDVQKLPHVAKTVSFDGSFPNRAISQPAFTIMKAARTIDQSKRPVIIAGFGAMGQGDNLLELAEKISAPIVSTYRGKGVVNEFNELYVGSHGGIGSTAASRLVRSADLLIVVGSSFSDMTQIPEKKTIQIDINPMMIAKQYPVEVGLLGNSAQLIYQLTDSVKENKKEEYRAEVKKLKIEWLKMLEEEIDSTKTPIRPPYIIKVLNDKLADDAIITIDIGENAWWFGRNFWMKDTQKMLMSGYLASMGFGLPAAITAQLVYPDRQVACITGDGGFSMLMADFMTALKNDLPINVFLFNNSELGMIRQEQMVEDYENWQTKLYGYDFAEFARTCGGIGIRVEKAEELESAVNKALKTDKATIVDINTDPVRFR